MSKLLKHYCHVWDKNGHHISFNNSKHVVQQMQMLMPGLKKRTIQNKCTKEFNGKKEGG